jgi:hypothetical protein
MRDPVGAEPGGQLVLVGYGTHVQNARADVASAYASYPASASAGWGYLLLTNVLPSGGNGIHRIHVYADGDDGTSTLLGTRTFTCANSTSVLPFGTIDTPGEGDTVSGVVNNFGWVLSRGTRRSDPPGGGTVTVYIDGKPVGAPTGWTTRADLTSLFPASAYAGIGTALGVFTFDSRAYADGVHTIGWAVTDNLGASAGIGSRFFVVANGTSVASALAAGGVTVK